MSTGHKAVIVGGLLLLLIGTMSYSRYASHRAHQQLLQFQTSLTLGFAQDHVADLFESAQYSELTLLQQREDIWIVTTPMEFGASNWCLYLAFANKSLTGISVRSVDDPTPRPPDAPPDLYLR